MMEFKYFKPSDILKPYVKYFYIFESGSDAGFEDIVFPSGDMEVIFNLGGGIWEASVNDKFLKNPPVELWGQITRPLQIRSAGKHTMLGVKFFTHSASYLLGVVFCLFFVLVSVLGVFLGGLVLFLFF